MKVKKISLLKYVISSENSKFDADMLLHAINECEDGTEIIFEPGNYYFPSPENVVKLENITKNIIFKAMDGARFIGGKSIAGAIPVSGDVKSRFFPEIRDKIFCVDLQKNGLILADVSGFVLRGFACGVNPSHSEIFADGIPLNLSCYPKDDYLNITGYGEEILKIYWVHEKVGKFEKGFYYDCERPEKWADSEEILAHGYWSVDYANSYEKIAAIDKKSRKITLKEPYGGHEFRIGQRFSFHNILEEVTECGDYYIDRKDMMLYFIPFDFEKLPEEILISTLKEPLWNIDKCENLCFEGFSIEAACGNGITVLNSKNIKISDCELKNIGNYAITINKSRNVTVTNCTIHDCGDGGISAACGNRATLEPGNVKIDNNHIYKIAKWTRTYQPAVNVTGVGFEITNNLIHDCPHTGILFWGNDIHIKNNEIYSVTLETGDAGAIYTGRDYTFRGNIVSSNYIHHVGGVGVGAMGIYNDDCVSGTVMEDNIFFEVQRAVFLGGGRNFQVRNNLFIDCYPSVEIDGRGTSDHKVWREMVDEYMRERFYNIKDVSATNEPYMSHYSEPAEISEHTVGAMNEPYISRYPELAEIDEYYNKNLPIPPSAIIEKNVYCSSRRIEFMWDCEPGEFTIHKNKSISGDYFEDCNIGFFNIKDGTDVEMYGFERLNIFDCGLDEKRRKKNPPKILTGLGYDGENLIYKYKNFSSQTVEAIVNLYSDKLLLLSFNVKFTATGEDTIKILFNNSEKKSVTIDAKSDTAGIRPCRLKI